MKTFFKIIAVIVAFFGTFTFFQMLPEALRSKDGLFGILMGYLLILVISGLLFFGISKNSGLKLTDKPKALSDNHSVESAIEEKEKTNQLGLFLILISIIGIISFIGYNLYNKNKEIHTVKTIPIESNYQNPIKDERKVNKKFLIATFKTEEPQVDYFEGYPDIHHLDGGFIKGVDSKTFVFLEERNYYSDIQEILNYNEDEKYRFLDAMESIMEDKLFMINVNFRSSLSVERDYSKRTSLEENKAKIISRDVVVFDSYSEASRYKQNMPK